MQKLPNTYKKRIATATERLITPHLHPDQIPLNIRAHRVSGPPISYTEAITRPFLPFQEGEPWGAQWDTTWFHITANIPAHWKNQSVIALINLSFDHHEGFGREGLVYLNGKPHTAVNRNRQAIPILENSQGGEFIEFYIEAASNPPAQWGWGDGDPLLPDYQGTEKYTLKTAKLATTNHHAFQLKIDFQACHQAMLELPESTPRHGQLLRALNNACSILESQNPENLTAARQALASVLSKKNGDTTHRITAIGHAHIDTAWCWPLRESIRKCARSFTTTLRLMERYPEYKFACSQPQQYAWMKHLYPSIYSDIKAAIKRGQWIPTGGMWIEADCNIPSGESLVRQILHGKQFFKNEFNIDVTDLWLPDVFGYAASLPQILTQSGIHSFLTQKISWSDTNKFPHHTFLWEGIDGSKIFTHFPPVDTYNAYLTATELKRAESNFQDNDRATRSLIPFGYGDGGGGPTAEQCEFLERWKNFEGLPTVESSSVDDFFEKAKKDAIDPPVWRGELYLELHRGTLTSQAQVKYQNRRCEIALREAEFLHTISHILNPKELLESDPSPERAIYDVPAHIPEKENSITAISLDRAWKLLLLNQFHDIIPGSSIQWVYQDAAKDYQTINNITKKIITRASQHIAQHIDTSSIENPLIIFNTLAHDRTQIITLPNGNHQLITIPHCGYTTIDSQSPSQKIPNPVHLTKTKKGFQITNHLIQLDISHQGLITSLIDLTEERQIIPDNQPANLFQLHNDIPNFWNAWDIDVFYRDNTTNLDQNATLTLETQTPHLITLKLERPFNNSKITQLISIKTDSKRIDFETTIDWQESNKLLKVAFPTNIHSLRATYDIQFGHVERPTHQNTSWDAAKFEVPVHQWADLSEGNYGVALLNDSKYAMDIHGHTLRLTLLKAANAPDPNADRGTHHFTYALYPHSGNLQSSQVIEQAQNLNTPLTKTQPKQHKGTLPPHQSLLSINRPGIHLTALKLAETSNSPITRIVETKNTRGPISLSSNILPGTPAQTNLLEQPTTTTHQILPHQIQTHIWK